jgi:ubiquinone/menaquinone biosynthesis C-methylase UbiE
MKNNERDVWDQSYTDGIITKRATSFPFLTFNDRMSVLDIGCGSCHDLEYLTEKFGVEGYGVDHVINKELKDKRLKKINFVLADISHLPFKEGAFEVSYSFGSIEHTRTLECIKESYRVTKSGGKVLHTVPNLFSLHTFFARPLLKIIGQWRLGTEQSFTLAKFYKMMRLNGFDLIQYKLAPFDLEIESKQFSSSLSVLLRDFKVMDNKIAKIVPFWGFFIILNGVKKVECK